MRRAIWASDESTTYCTKCRVDFGFRVFKHHCRKCGLIFCNECSRSKLLIPQDEIVLRPANPMSQKMPEVFSHDDDFRAPQRVCDGCSHLLRNQQGDLRLLVSRAYQETVVDIKERPTSIPSIDFYLENEIKNATIMLYNFKLTLGEEKIPKELLEIAKGVVFLTIAKCGFMFTARYGTGLVVAKLEDDSWSAPSAVTMSGIGWGLQVGAELTEVMLILSTEEAVKTFMSRAQISVGAELGVSVGPIGRSVASDVTAGNKGAAHAFSYAHSKGLFFGASLEASGLASRPDVNRIFYGEKVKPSALLSGEYPRPKGAEPLYTALDEMMKDAGVERIARIPPEHTGQSSRIIGGGAGGGGLGATRQESSQDDYRLREMKSGGGGGGGGGGGNRGVESSSVSSKGFRQDDYGLGYVGSSDDGDL